MSLQQEFEQVCLQKESFWKQKARHTWLALGDNNTTYFHTLATIKYARSKVAALRDAEGTFTDDPTKLKAIAIDFYTSLYTNDLLEHTLETQASFIPVPASYHQALCCPPIKEEVKKALFSMKGKKVPGPDGILSKFYQKEWDTVKTNFMKLATGVFAGRTGVPSINGTFLSLVPKVPRFETITQFRPIGLCNVNYKTLAKILV